MGFLNPALAWFAVGAAIPVIIHLLNRQRYRRVRWAAMEFLLNAIKRTQRIVRIENLILLLVRMLIMALLAVAIAKPFFSGGIVSKGNVDTHHIFVIDNSYSMGYKTGQLTALRRAVQYVRQLLQDRVRLGKGDMASIVLLSDNPTIWLQPTTNKEKVFEELDRITLSDFGTSLPKTLPLVKELFPKSGLLPRRVYILTDMQKNAWTVKDDDEAAKFNELLKELSKQTAVRDDPGIFIIDVGADKPDNVAVMNVTIKDRFITTKRKPDVVAEIHNFSSEEKKLNVTLKVDDGFGETEEVHLLPNSDAPVHFNPEFAEAGPHKLMVEIPADNLDKDDKRTVAVDVKESAKILTIDGEPKQPLKPFSGETFFFKCALAPSGGASPFELDIKEEPLFIAQDLDKYDFVVLANVRSLSQEKVQKIAEYVKNGGGLLISLGHEVDRKSFNEFFYANDFYKELNKKLSVKEKDLTRGLSPCLLSETIREEKMELHDKPASVRQEAYGPPFSLMDVHFDHKTLELFKKAGIQTPFLNEFHFYQFYKMDKEALRRDLETKRVSVLARYTDPDETPAVLERLYGEGRVILLNTTLSSEWNNLTQFPLYVPWMNEMAYYLASKPGTNRNLKIVDPLKIVLPLEVLANEKGGRNFMLYTPEGGGYLSLNPQLEVEGLKEQNKFMLTYDGLTKAGLYQLYPPDAQQDKDKPISYFAVNVNSEESNLERITVEDLQNRYKDFKFKVVKPETAPASGEALQAGSGIWRHLLYLVLGLLAVEMILAWLFGRHKQ